MPSTQNALLSVLSRPSAAGERGVEIGLLLRHPAEEPGPRHREARLRRRAAERHRRRRHGRLRHGFRGIDRGLGLGRAGAANEDAALRPAHRGGELGRQLLIRRDRKELLLELGGQVARLLQRQRASRRQVLSADRRCVREGDRDVVVRIVDRDLERVRDRVRLVERDREAERRAAIDIVEGRVVPLGERQVVSALAGIGVELILREADEVLVGERLHLVLRRGPVVVGVEPLDRPGRERLVEHPLVPDPGEPALGVERRSSPWRR